MLRQKSEIASAICGAILVLSTALLLLGCSDPNRPSHSEVSTQVKSYDWTKFLYKRGVYDMALAVLIGANELEPFIVPDQVNYENGFALDSNNYVVAVRVDFRYAKSATEVKAELDRICKAPTGDLEMVCRWSPNADPKNSGFKSGQSASTQKAEFRFLKTEKGWILQNMLNPPD